MKNRRHIYIILTAVAVTVSTIVIWTFILIEGDKTTTKSAKTTTTTTDTSSSPKSTGRTTNNLTTVADAPWGHYSYEKVNISIKYYPKTWVKKFRVNWNDTSCQMQCDWMFDDNKGCTGFHFVTEYICALLFLDPEVFNTSVIQPPPTIEIAARTELKKGYVVLTIGGNIALPNIYSNKTEIISLNSTSHCSAFLQDTPFNINLGILELIANKPVLCYSKSDRAKMKCYYYHLRRGEWTPFTSSFYGHSYARGVIFDNRLWISGTGLSEFYDAKLDIWDRMANMPIDGGITCKVEWNGYLVSVNGELFQFYHFATNRWSSKIYRLPTIPPIAIGCIIIPRTDFFIATSYNVAYMVNLRNDTVKSIQVPSYSIGYSTLFAAGSRVFSAGGALVLSSQLNTIYELKYSNINSISWTKLNTPTLLQPRYYQQMLALPQFLFNCT